LNLHYLISAYGSADLHAEILLGYAMQLLHENAVLTRAAIQTALQPSTNVSNTLPPALRSLADAGLESQVEPLRITPEFLDAEELSKFWTASQARYRPCAAYQVSVVLIQSTAPARASLPVLKTALGVAANRLPAVPTLESIEPAGGRPALELGTSATVRGHHLRGAQRSVRLRNDRFQIDQVLAAAADDSDDALVFSIPLARAADFPVGVYRVGVRLGQGGGARETNQLAVALAPRVEGLPQTVARNPDGSATLSVAFHPTLRGGQSASLLLGSRECTPEPFSAPATSLVFAVEDAPVGEHLVRLRIDGIDSAIIDGSARPPVFLDQRLTIT
jgi:hypothetical protein